MPVGKSKPSLAADNCLTTLGYAMEAIVIWRGKPMLIWVMGLILPGRKDISGLDTTMPGFSGGVSPRESETHSGEDVLFMRPGRVLI